MPFQQKYENYERFGLRLESGPWIIMPQQVEKRLMKYSLYAFHGIRRIHISVQPFRSNKG